ncbi:phage tail protein I [Nocardioides albidus]|uniref:Phage tail protein I n=1 Tax=Nocardioides albidus TaxID=1517589 RepID=A0A5C4VV68_9ACTN|nr:phage tail protein I [Nocardioides albidus]TNM39708.1 phage tail protein I [Nocardioides albidus]
MDETRTSRGQIPGLDSPVPVLHRLPGVLQDDEFLQRFVRAFDDGYAPIFATLDSLWSYFDPHLAPEDFLAFLAAWVGVELDDSWDLAQRRAVIARAAQVHRRRGTARGIQEALSLGLGVEVEVRDSGGCVWSQRPDGDLPGVAQPHVAVRIRAADPASVDTRRVDALLEATKPAHVAHSFVVNKEGKP